MQITLDEDEKHGTVKQEFDDEPPISIDELHVESLEEVAYDISHMVKMAATSKQLALRGRILDLSGMPNFFFSNFINYYVI